MHHSRNIYGYMLLAVVMLSGCGLSSSSKISQTEIAGFLLNIPATFTKKNTALVENKQIIDKVLQARSIDVPLGFDKTLLFTTSIIAPQIDYEQFYTVNMKKLAQYVPGYIQGERAVMSFSCGKEKVDGLWVTFGVKSGLLDDNAMYYFGQYQFVKGGSGYILSYATDTSADRDTMKDTITNISCK